MPRASSSCESLALSLSARCTRSNCFLATQQFRAILEVVVHIGQLDQTRLPGAGRKSAGRTPSRAPIRSGACLCSALPRCPRLSCRSVDAGHRNRPAYLRGYRAATRRREWFFIIESEHARVWSWPRGPDCETYGVRLSPAPSDVDGRGPRTPPLPARGDPSWGMPHHSRAPTTSR
jgi:hypothetical protein